MSSSIEKGMKDAYQSSRYAPISVDELIHSQYFPKLNQASSPGTVASQGSSIRTYESNYSEYDNEKWGRALLQIENGKLKSVADVNRFFIGSGERAGLVNGQPCIGSGAFIYDLYMKEMLSHISNSWTGESFVDLGAGYGAYAISFLREKMHASSHLETRKAKNFALEFTETGRRCIQLLAPPEINLLVDKCDFYQDPVVDVTIPEGSFLLTSFSLACLTQTPNHMISSLLKMKPLQVCHVEPIFPAAPSSQLEELRRDYAVHNGYNTDLWANLVKAENENRIQILSVREAKNATNPLLVPSVVTWRPV